MHEKTRSTLYITRPLHNVQFLSRFSKDENFNGRHTISQGPKRLETDLPFCLCTKAGQKRTLLKALLTALLWYIFLLSTTTALCTDKTATLTASFDSKSAHVGETICLILKYRLPQGWRLSPDSPIKGLDGLCIVSKKIQPNVIRIRLLVDRLKILKTGKLSIVCMDEKGKQHILSTHPVSLKVVSNLGKSPEDAHLKPICDIIPVRPYWLRILPWISLSLLAIALICGLLWWLKKKKTKIKTSEKTLPPHIEATQKITELEKRGLFEKGHIKEYYFSLSAILKRYIEAIRGFPAAELTTEEIAKAIQHKEDMEIVRLLREADLIKFSNKTPSPAKKEEHIKAAMSYIELTKPDETLA